MHDSFSSIVGAPTWAPVSICKNPVITDLPERARHVRAPTEKGLSHMQQPLFPHYSTMPRRSGTMVN